MVDIVQTGAVGGPDDDDANETAKAGQGTPAGARAPSRVFAADATQWTHRPQSLESGSAPDAADGAPHAAQGAARDQGADAPSDVGKLPNMVSGDQDPSFEPGASMPAQAAGPDRAGGPEEDHAREEGAAPTDTAAPPQSGLSPEGSSGVTPGQAPFENPGAEPRQPVADPARPSPSPRRPIEGSASVEDIMAVVAADLPPAGPLEQLIQRTYSEDLLLGDAIGRMTDDIARQSLPEALVSLLGDRIGQDRAQVLADSWRQNPDAARPQIEVALQGVGLNWSDLLARVLGRNVEDFERALRLAAIIRRAQREDLTGIAMTKQLQASHRPASAGPQGLVPNGLAQGAAQVSAQVSAQGSAQGAAPGAANESANGAPHLPDPASTEMAAAAANEGSSKQSAPTAKGPARPDPAKHKQRLDHTEPDAVASSAADEPLTGPADRQPQTPERETSSGNRAAGTVTEKKSGTIRRLFRRKRKHEGRES